MKTDETGIITPAPIAQVDQPTIELYTADMMLEAADQAMRAALENSPLLFHHWENCTVTQIVASLCEQAHLWNIEATVGRIDPTATVAQFQAKYITIGAALDALAITFGCRWRVKVGTICVETAHDIVMPTPADVAQLAAK